MSASMTHIDFHTNVPDKLPFTCRLIRKAANEGWQTVVFCTDAEEQARLDRALWTFSEHDFLPHVAADDPLAAVTPVILTCRHDQPLPHNRLLINLSASSPTHFARFERLIEVVSTDPDETVAGRQRFAYYRQRGYPLKHHPRSANEQPVQ
jgi:DNA polymerase-3 subunit chi